MSAAKIAKIHPPINSAEAELLIKQLEPVYEFWRRTLPDADVEQVDPLATTWFEKATESGFNGSQIAMAAIAVAIGCIEAISPQE